MLPSSSSSSSNQQRAVPHTTTTNSTTTTLADDHHFLLHQEQLLLYAPIDFTTQSQISGSESQILEIQLRPNQILRAESGAMLYMSQGITMETSMGVVGASSSSSPSTSSMFATGFTRLMTGQNLMISDFRYVPQPISTTTTTTTPTTINTDENDIHGGGADYSTTSGTIGLGTDFPAKILKFDLSSYPSHKLICQKGAYLAGSYGVTMDMAYVKSFAGGFFGGEGFILQCLQAGEIPSGRTTTATSISSSSPPPPTTTPPPTITTTTKNNSTDVTDYEEGPRIEDNSTVFLKAYGTVVKRDLQPGEKLRISSGSLVCMTSTIEYDVTMMPGFANVMFGGQGLFVTTLTGPGTVWLQSMPIDRMVSEIARHVPSGGGIGLGIPIMGGGGGSGDSGAGVDAGADGDAAGAAAVGPADVGGDDVVVGDVGSSGDTGVSAMTNDAAIEADRNATIASSAGVPSSSDPESPESLFGDAAYGDGSGTSGLSSSSSSSPDTTFSTTSDEDATNAPDFDESTISEDDLFEDDGTTFSTYDDGGGNATEMPPTPDGGEGSSSILGQLWDLFRDFTDRD